MSSNHFPVVDTITLQLTTLLEEYQEDVGKLALGWPVEQDMELYLRVSRQMDGLRDLCSTRPEVTVQWVALLISHAELMHMLWRVSQGRAQPSLARHHEEHQACIRALALKCERLVPVLRRLHGRR